MQVLVNQESKAVNLPAWGGEPQQAKAKITCRRCGSDHCERIRRGVIVKMLLPWTSLKHYQCVRCMNKFYRFK